jgi:O-antigen ligase
MFASELLLNPAWYYYAWAIGACAVPMIGAALWSPRIDKSVRSFLIIFVMLSFVSCLASFQASSIGIDSSQNEEQTGRLFTQKINPILLGQLGGTLFLISIWAITNQQLKLKKIFKVIFYFSLLLGAGLLVSANSRGPIVSIIVGLVFMVIFSKKTSRWYNISLIVVGIIAFVPVLQYIETEFGFSTYTRLFGQSQLTEDNTLDRFSRYQLALDSFQRSPFWGASLEEPTIGGYPHNILIETLMSMGLFGFFLLISLLVTTLVFAARVFLTVPSYGWVSILFVQYFVAAQFSGSIYTSTYLWVSVGLVIAVYATLAPSAKRRNIGRPVTH